MECKIVNEKGQELGDDQEGEFLFRGPSIMKGYYNNAKANAETFTDDGWMRTGDVGKYDSKTGEFFILDRIKELIKYKGYQVAPAELEAILMGLDIIADCCVVGLYDESQATEIPRAYIVLQPTVEQSAKTAKLIDEYVASNVTNYKKLRGGVKFVDVIPKSPSGKILRRQVKDWVKKEQKEIAAKARL
jgi:acyl-CoA synthetase (AMP-forming)/AMP-acid ligase II